MWLVCTYFYRTVSLHVLLSPEACLCRGCRRGCSWSSQRNPDAHKHAPGFRCNLSAKLSIATFLAFPFIFHFRSRSFLGSAKLQPHFPISACARPFVAPWCSAHFRSLVVCGGRQDATGREGGRRRSPRGGEGGPVAAHPGEKRGFACDGGCSLPALQRGLWSPWSHLCLLGCSIFLVDSVLYFNPFGGGSGRAPFLVHICSRCRLVEWRVQ